MSVAIAVSPLYIASVIQCIIVVTEANGVFIGSKGQPVPVNYPKFDIIFNIRASNYEGCTNEIIVSGKGIKDHFYTQCKEGGSFNGVTSIANEKFLVFQSSETDIELFTKTPSTLVVFRGEQCSKRTYTTSGSKTTFTESSLTKSQCEDQRREMEETKEKWSRDFSEYMHNMFPPCFPFCDSKGDGRSSKDSDQQRDEGSDSSEDSSEKIVGNGATSPNYWTEWSENFNEHMRKKFPPCFPFCNNKKK